MKSIVFDVDGTLADFITGYTKLGNREFGTPILSTYDIKYWDESMGMTTKQHAYLWHLIRKSDSFWYDLQPFGCVNFKPLEELGFTFVFSTARVGVDVIAQTQRWLQFYHDMLQKPNVIINPSHHRGELVKALDPEFFIDDKAGNAVYAAYACPETKVFLVNRDYNTFDHRILGKPVKRVNSVSEFIDHVIKG